MANTLITPEVIAKEALMQLKNNCIFGSRVHRTYKNEFVKKGDTIRVRKPVMFIANTTEDVTSAVRDVVEEYESITVDQFRNVAFKFPGSDLTLTIEQYSERYIKPAAIELAQQIDLSVAGLYTDVYQASGTPGTDPASYGSMGDAAKQLDNSAVPNDGNRYMVLNPNGFHSMSENLTSLYLEKLASKAYETAKMPQVASFNMPDMSQSIESHTAASQTTVDVHATLTNASTLNELHMNGLDNDLVVGDIFTVASVYEVNPRTRKSTGNLKKFTVTTALTVTGTNDTVTFSPRIIMSDDLGQSGTPVSQGPPHQNVDSYPAVNDVVTFAASHAANLAFHKNAFALVTVPMEMPDSVGWKARASEDGYSIRVVKDYDILTNQETCRLDVLYGVSSIYPQLACRVYGAVA